MHNIIRDLYYGKISPWECRYPRNSAFLELDGKIKSAEKYFTQTLSEEGRASYKELTGLYDELGNLELEDVFTYGFSLGVLITADATGAAEAAGAV